ncbi:MAG: 50S ribosomal protein L20 [Cyanobacteria bacterium NC_groundwater_1444_Ag_S-0.65um_54_12]|nr:50S ribosomal protein L20 [Cyanobacteria bacterium NC_groundwater_1444_Ag_S-0.65um_54_12]
MRVKRGNVNRRKHKKVLKLTRGFRAGTSKLFRTANQAMMKALRYMYRHRRERRGDFRRLWIQRINAAARQNGMNYSQLINGLRKAEIIINRKILAELAILDSMAFAQLVARAKEAHEREKATA